MPPNLIQSLLPAYGLLLQCHAYRKGWGLILKPDEESAEVARLARIVSRIGQDDAAALNNTGWAVAYILAGPSSCPVTD